MKGSRSSVLRNRHSHPRGRASRLRKAGRSLCGARGVRAHRVRKGGKARAVAAGIQRQPAAPCWMGRSAREEPGRLCDSHDRLLDLERGALHASRLSICARASPPIRPRQETSASRCRRRSPAWRSRVAVADARLEYGRRSILSATRRSRPPEASLHPASRRDGHDEQVDQNMIAASAR